MYVHVDQLAVQHGILCAPDRSVKLFSKQNELVYGISALQQVKYH